jgi:hypothetical protein
MREKSSQQDVANTLENGTGARTTPTTREHARLKDTKEEPTRQQAAVVLHHTLHHGSEAEEEHVGRQPYMWAEALQQDIGRDLEDDIGHEEDDEGDVVFVAREVQIFREVKNVGIANVDTICALSV